MAYFFRAISFSRRKFFATVGCCSYLALNWKCDTIRLAENKLFNKLFLSHSFAEVKEYVSERRVPYLIVGGGVSAYSAVSSILASDDAAKVLLVTKECYKPYIRSYLPRILADGKKINVDSLRRGTNDDLFLLDIFEKAVEVEDLFNDEEASLSHVLEREVVSIDTEKREALLNDGKIIKFNKILIATGSHPKSFGVLEVTDSKVRERVFHTYNVEDCIRFSDIIKEDNREITILGDNPYSLDLLTNLARNHKVTIVCNGSRIMEKYLPSYLSEETKKELEKLGIRVICGLEVTSAGYYEDQAHLSFDDGSVVACDAIIDLYDWGCPMPFIKDGSCKGRACLSNFKDQGYKVNALLQSGGSDIYVAGSAAVSYDVFWPGYRKVQSLDHSISSGEIAGRNMSGKDTVVYDFQSHLSIRLPGPVTYKLYGVVDSTMETVSVWEDSEGDDNSHFLRKGVVFYVKDGYVDAILTWNITDASSLADGIIRSKVSHVDHKELAKYFFEEKQENS